MAGKTLYHSELVQMGDVQVTVLKEAQPSKFKGKAAFVVLAINGEEKLYNCENPSCEAFFQGTANTAFTLRASGSRDEALLEYVEASVDGDTPPPPPRPAPRPPARPAPAARPPARPAAPVAARPVAISHAPQGVTVGMAINNACAFHCAAKQDFNPETITQMASEILRIAAWLEQGNLMPKAESPLDQVPM